jgi:2-keto-4-pentenoate hydratase/2-oxohepta-3-ene-1,7-dioic acid hydratase in catechol pathway
MELLFEGDHHDHPYEHGTIFCIGRNYVEHIQELGNEVPKDPIVFVKPDCALRHGSYNIAEYPPHTEALEFEGATFRLSARLILSPDTESVWI